MTVGLGHKSYVGVGEETTYGTAVARTKFLDIISEGITPADAKMRSGQLRLIGHNVNNMFLGNRAVQGDIQAEVHWEGFELFLKHLLGSVATAQPDTTAGPTVYKHTFSIADALPVGLTMEVFKDSSGFSGGDLDTAFILHGTKINQASFNIGVEGALMATLGIISRDQSFSAKSSPSFTTKKLVSFAQAGFKFNAVSVDISEFELTISNNLQTDRRFLGSRIIKEPLRAGKLEVTGRFVAEFADLTLFRDAIVSSIISREMILTFTGETIQGGYPQELKFTLPVSVLEAVELGVDDPGPIPIEVTFSGVRDTSNNELNITLQNTVSSV